MPQPRHNVSEHRLGVLICLSVACLGISLVAAVSTNGAEVGGYGELQALDGTRNHYGSRGYEEGPPVAVSHSMLGHPPPPADRHRWWPPLYFQHSDPNDPGRHVGLGEPLAGTSWLNRPFQAGWLVGALWGDDLTSSRVEQGSGLLGGYRLGWDFDHYWGTEGRFAFSNLRLSYPQTGTAGGTASNHFWDVNLLYYPWGDARWRPYLSLGMGAANFRYWDDLGRRTNETAFALPIGLGVKYRWKKWLALRGDLTNNWSFGAGRTDSMHSVSLTLAAEVQFGGMRKSYFPFDAGW